MLYVMEVSENKIKIVFSSVLKNISEVIEDAVEFLSKRDFEYDQFSFKLAIAEGLTNAVKHGNAFNPRLRVSFSLDISGNKLIMTFVDQGDGFDWKSALELELPDVQQTSGRGLLLLKSYGYTVKYNEVGNVLCLIK